MKLVQGGGEFLQFAPLWQISRYAPVQEAASSSRKVSVATGTLAEKEEELKARIILLGSSVADPVLAKFRIQGSVPRTINI